MYIYNSPVVYDLASIYREKENFFAPDQQMLGFLTKIEIGVTLAANFAAMHSVRTGLIPAATHVQGGQVGKIA